MQLHYLTSLLEIQGFCVENLSTEKRQGQNVVVVHLKRETAGYVCGHCFQTVTQGYDSAWQDVQHLMLWQHLTVLRYKRYRVNCPRCGIRTEALNFVGLRGPRVTHRLARLVCELCKVMTNQAVGLFQGLHRGTVKEIDKEAMERVQAERSLDGITVLGVDEIAVGHGQTYWTMVSALDGPRGPELLDVVKGRKEKNLKPFWKRFGKERAKLITHGVMDMWKAFRNSFTEHCPGIQIIYDKFHVIQHLLKALNEIRGTELRRASGTFKHALAGKKFILLSRKAHVRGNARKALNQVLGANRKLLKAHVLKESFGQLWSYTSKTWARKFFQGWVDQLKWSRLKPYFKFAAMVEKHFDGILSYCDKKVSLGYIESTNLKAKNVMRQAYGYRDDHYCKLKIIQACTPWMRQFRPWTLAHTNSS